MNEKKLYKVTEGKMISGVCAGLAEYFSLDVNLVRIVVAAVALITAALPIAIAYLVCMLILPEKPVEEPAEEAAE